MTTHSPTKCMPALLALMIIGAATLAAQTAPTPAPPKASTEQPTAAPEAPTAYAYVVRSGEGNDETAASAAGVASASSGSMVWVGPDGKKVSVRSFAGRRAYLGVGLVQITSDLRSHFGAPAAAGVLISEIVKGSPADKAGLRVGDVLTTIDGEPVADKWEVVQKIAAHSKGDRVSLRLIRDRHPVTVRATLDETTRPSFDVAPFILHGSKGGATWHFDENGGGSIDVPDIDVDLPDAPAPPQVIEIRKEAIDRAMKELNQKLESPEFRERLREAQERSVEIEKRTAELEARLRAVQEELQSKQKVELRQLEEQLRSQSRELERKQQQIDRLNSELDALRQQEAK